MPMPVTMTMPMRSLVPRCGTQHSHSLVQYEKRRETSKDGPANDNVSSGFHSHTGQTPLIALSKECVGDEMEEYVAEETTRGECNHGVEGRGIEVGWDGEEDKVGDSERVSTLMQSLIVGARVRTLTMRCRMSQGL